MTAATPNLSATQTRLPKTAGTETMRTKTVRTVMAAAAVALAALPISGLSAGAAAAADLGGNSRGGYAPPPVAPRIDLERWTGFYLGATLGGNVGSTGIAGDFGAGNLDTKGYNGGILAGYNWQLGRMVLGVETDLSKMNLSGTASNGFDRYQYDIDALGSFRGRAGFLVSPSLLVYATGGYAWAHSSIGLEGGERTKGMLSGYQIGGGTELKINPNWTLRLEYLYTDLGDKTFTNSGLVNRFDTDFHTVRAGITFKF